ncbi:MAG: prolipoprotein diacylglyceryl transferase [Deltaproteobacteria bacterium]
MAPVLFKCPLFTIYTYGAFVALAFLVCVPLWARAASRRGLDGERITTLGLVLLASGIAGARLLYVALDWEDFAGDWLEIARLYHGGLAWFGGLLGAGAALVVYARRQRWKVAVVLDTVAPFAALGQGIGRIGCFFNGCCHGFPVAWGLYFQSAGMRLFPSQLLDAATLGLAALFLARRLREERPAGTVFAWYLVLAGLQRFLMEFIRGDMRPYYFGLSVFQWMALAVMAAGVAMLAGRRRWHNAAA